MPQSQPVTYATPGGLTVHRLEPAIGAQIEGARLDRPISAQHAADIRKALQDHGVIFFRDQPMNYEQHVALAAVFGEVWIEGFLPDKPAVMPLISDHGSFNPAGGHWHSDGTYLPVPPEVSVLYCHKAAPLGGDTLFSSAAAVWAACRWRKATERPVAWAGGCCAVGGIPIRWD